MGSRPSELQAWTVGKTSARVQPTSGEQLAGYVANQRPAAGQHNWLFGILSDWTIWFDSFTNPANVNSVVTASATVAPPLMRYLGNPTAGSFTLTLPAAASSTGAVYTFKNIST